MQPLPSQIQLATAPTRSAVCETLCEIFSHQIKFGQKKRRHGHLKTQGSFFQNSHSFLQSSLQPVHVERGATRVSDVDFNTAQKNKNKKRCSRSAVFL